MDLFNKHSFTILRMSEDGAYNDGIYIGGPRIEIPATGHIEGARPNYLETEQNAALQGKDIEGCVFIGTETQLFVDRNSDLRKADVISFDNKMYEIRKPGLPRDFMGTTRYHYEAELIEVLDDGDGSPVYGDAFRPYPYNQDVEISGVINGINKVFILATAIKPGSLELFNGSVKYQPSDYDLADDGITVTLKAGTTAPSAGDSDNDIPADILTARGAY